MISGAFPRSYAVDLRTLSTNATNATFSHSFDSVQGSVKFNAAVVDCFLPVASATNVSAIWQVLRLESSNDGTTWTTVPGCEGTSGTPSTSQFQLVVHNNTSVRQITRISAPLVGRGSKLRIVAQTPASTNNHNVQLYATLFNSDVVPDTTTEMGVAAFGQAVPG